MLITRKTAGAVQLSTGVQIVLSPLGRYAYDWLEVFARRVYLDLQGRELFFHLDKSPSPLRVREITYVDLSGLVGGGDAPYSIGVDTVIGYNDGGGIGARFEYVRLGSSILLYPTRVHLQDRCLLSTTTLQLNTRIENFDATLEGNELKQVLRTLAPFAPKISA